MSKIICEICGTTYPDSAESCPICGCSRDAASDFLGGNDFMTEEVVEDPREKTAKAAPKKKKEIFDFDVANSDFDDELAEENNPYTEEEDAPVYEERHGHNVFVVILLTILIVVLLGAAGFIFVRYFLPNMKGDDDHKTLVTEAVAESTEVPTTEARIPCQMLILTSGTVELNTEGQMFLLHVQPTPEDTTDEVIYTSADESIATVTADGKVTAVSEGETVIYITCGDVQTPCPVVVTYVEETVAETEAAETESAETAATEADEIESAETEPAETEPANEPARKDVTLKLKQVDIRLGVYYQYQLKLDCDLAQNEVEWRSEHPHIAKVDENGVVTAVKDGTTSIIAKYGDQEVSCIVRCIY